MKRWTQKRYREYLAKRNGLKAAAKTPRNSTWSEPEKRYFYGVLGGKGTYEPEHIVFTPRCAERHTYTPDFLTNTSFGAPVYHEVKGSYRLKSQDSARIRFVMASCERSLDFFVWAKERNDRRWDIEIFMCGGVIAKAKGVVGFEFNAQEEVVWRR